MIGGNGWVGRCEVMKLCNSKGCDGRIMNMMHSLMIIDKIWLNLP